MTLGEIVARRRKSAMTTRGEMLHAARQRFIRESYENVGLRDIARDVGVDVALVGRYFGSKEELFREVLQGEEEDKLNVDLPISDLPAYLVSLIAEKDAGADRDHAEKLLLVLRSASSPTASEIVRKAVRADVLEPLAALLGGPEAETKASFILAILLGTTVLRTVMAVEPLCEGNQDKVHEKLIRLFEIAIAE
jgi:AcrR family transcriptional regulator